MKKILILILFIILTMVEILPQTTNYFIRERDVAAISMYAQAGTTDSAKFASALAQAGSNPATIYLPKDTIDLGTTIKISPSNVTLVAPVGSIFADSLVIKGGFEGSLSQHFITAVNMDSAKIAEVYVEWWGAVNSRIINSRNAFQMAANSVPRHGTVKLTAIDYNIDTDSVMITKPLTMEGHSTIWQTNGGAKNLLVVNADSVTFRNFSIEGTRPSNWDAIPAVGAISLKDGTYLFHASNIKIKNKQAGFHSNITASDGLTNITIEHCKIDSVRTGVAFGGVNPGDFVNKNIKILYNEVTCTDGALTSSRNFSIINSVNLLIEGNVGLGGGMAVELLNLSPFVTNNDSYADYSLNQVISKNTFDVGVSGGTQHLNNTLDGSLIPAGRGWQSGYFICFETAPNALVQGNTVKNMPVNVFGIHVNNRNLRIIGNTFTNMREGGFGTITISTAYNNPFNYFNVRNGVIISNNTFEYVDTPLNMTVGAGAFVPKNIIFSNNTVNHTKKPITILAGSNFKFEHNRFYNCLDTNTITADRYALLIQGGDNMTVAHNEFKNDSDTLGTAAGVAINTPVTNAKLYMNEFTNMLSFDYLDLSTGAIIYFNIEDGIFKGDALKFTAGSQFLAPNGTSAIPSYSFTNHPTYGFKYLNGELFYISNGDSGVVFNGATIRRGIWNAGSVTSTGVAIFNGLGLNKFLGSTQFMDGSTALTIRSAADVFSNQASGYIFTTDGTAGGIGGGLAGQLVIQPRTNAARDIIFAAGTPTPTEQFRIKAAGGISAGGVDGTLAVAEVYDATNWDGDLSGAQKNDVRDKIESMKTITSISAPSGTGRYNVDSGGINPVEIQKVTITFSDASTLDVLVP